MCPDTLNVKKTQKEVRLWIHPDGLVIGAIFLRLKSTEPSAQEGPQDVLNKAEPFLVCRRSDPDEIRFYNRSAIIRVEYEDPQEPAGKDTTQIPCRLTMMDGSVIEGTIIETLPAEYSRLYDYLNQDQDRFLRIYTGRTDICLINKAYITQVVALDSLTAATSAVK